MSKKVKPLIASALILAGNITIFAMEQTNPAIPKRIFGEYSAYESSKKIKYNPESGFDEHFNYEIIEIPNCTKHAVKITPNCEHTDQQNITEEKIRQFLLSKEDIFHRKYKTYILDKKNAIAYADAIVIDSKIKIEENFLAGNKNWCKLVDDEGMILKKDCNIYTKVKLKDKFYDTDFYEIHETPSPSNSPSEEDSSSISNSFKVFTYGGEELKSPKNLDEFLEIGDISQYYEYEMTTAPGYAQKVLKITPKYSDSLSHDINWRSVKKYLFHNQNIFERLGYLSKTDHSNSLEKLDAILIHGSGEPSDDHNENLYNDYTIYRKGSFFKLFIKTDKKDSHPENLLKNFAKEEAKKTLADSSSSPKSTPAARSEVVNNIRLSAFKIMPNNLYALSITPKTFDSYGSQISCNDIKNFIKNNVDILKTPKLSQNFFLTDYFDIIIFDSNLVDYSKIKLFCKDFAYTQKPYNVGIIAQRLAIKKIPTNSFFKNFKLSFGKDLEYIITDGKWEPWDKTTYAESQKPPANPAPQKSFAYATPQKLPEYESPIGTVEESFGKSIIPQNVKRYFKLRCRRSLNLDLSNDYILSAEIYPDEIPVHCDKFVLKIDHLRNYILKEMYSIIPDERSECSADRFDYLDILIIDNSIKTNYPLPLKPQDWVKFHKGLNCTMYVKRKLLTKITREGWHYILSYISAPGTL